MNKIRKENDYKGKEIFEIQPIILGGSPTDSSNKTALSRKDHIKTVTYWNKIIRDLRKKQHQESNGLGSGNKCARPNSDRIDSQIKVV